MLCVTFGAYLLLYLDIDLVAGSLSSEGSTKKSTDPSKVLLTNSAKKIGGQNIKTETSNTYLKHKCKSRIKIKELILNQVCKFGKLDLKTIMSFKYPKLNLFYFKSQLCICSLNRGNKICMYLIYIMCYRSMLEKLVIMYKKKVPSKLNLF